MTKKKPIEDHIPNGRPTSYKPEYPDLILIYFRSQEEKVYEDIEFYKASEEQITNHMKDPQKDGEHIHGPVKRRRYKGSKVMIPTFERRCSNIGIHKDTLYERAKVHPLFSDSLRICKQIQEAILMECGLNNIFNPTITQLMLKNNHDRSDKQDLNLGGQANNPIKVELNEDQMQKIADRFSKKTQDTNKDNNDSTMTIM